MAAYPSFFKQVDSIIHTQFQSVQMCSPTVLIVVIKGLGTERATCASPTEI